MEDIKHSEDEQAQNKDEEQVETNEEMPDKEQVDVKESKQKDKHSKIKNKKEDKKSEQAQKIEEDEKKINELQDQLLRTRAEFDNFRKRSQREKDVRYRDGIAYAAENLLDVLDVLQAAADAPTTDEKYKEGVLLTLSKCEAAFEKLGIEEIDAADSSFDPNLHNAVMQEPKEGVESGEITRVMGKGYKIGDKVIRHSMVAVAP